MDTLHPRTESTGRALELLCQWTTPLKLCPETTTTDLQWDLMTTTALDLHLRSIQASTGEHTWMIATGNMFNEIPVYLGFKACRLFLNFSMIMFCLIVNLLLLSRPVHPDGYRTLDPNYRAPSRNQLDPYAAQPQVC